MTLSRSHSCDPDLILRSLMSEQAGLDLNSFGCMHQDTHAFPGGQPWRMRLCTRIHTLSLEVSPGGQDRCELKAEM